MSAARYLIPAAAIAALFMGGKKVITTEIIKRRAEPYMTAIDAAERQYGLPPGLEFKLLETESSYRQEIIDGTEKSPVGAVGIAQFMPATAAWLTGLPQDQAIKYVQDPYKAIPLAAKYLAQLRKSKGITNWEQTIAAYNWGVGNVAKATAKYGAVAYKDHLPQETKNYIVSISSGVGVSLTA